MIKVGRGEVISKREGEERVGRASAGPGLKRVFRNSACRGQQIKAMLVLLLVVLCHLQQPRHMHVDSFSIA